MNYKCLLFTAVSAFSLMPILGEAQELSTEVRQRIGEFLDTQARQEVSVGKISIDSIDRSGKTLTLYANLNLSYVPLRKENVASIYQGVRRLLPQECSKDELVIRTNNRKIEELIPVALREKQKKTVHSFAPTCNRPLVTPVSATYTPTHGLTNRHIALWQSHGWYYEQQLDRWEWQRARIFQTVEDLYTQSYVLPFLVPMLENAGANVLMPRERDWQTNEFIIDNDGCRNSQSVYSEITGSEKWTSGREPGFAHARMYYTQGQNPFKEGTFRMTESIKKGAESRAEWTTEIPARGEYAVYVAYQTLPNSTEEARYTVHHAGGSSEFCVNQQMGGGTWIYLGTFTFEPGKAKVSLSNRTAKKGQIITADAVKIGGGMGNIARGRQESPMPAISGYPRFCEAARYWMQWAGVPDSIYSLSQGSNDYTDDYKSRGLWVNYLCGGSVVNPSEEGLHIPVDMAFAFHSDAGTTLNDSIIGTLGIYFTGGADGKFANGASRYLSHDLTDLIQSNIVRDIRTLYEPEWTRRGMWNKSYFEARTPQVPTMLLELLSHQNFADMRYGLDPRFRFTVSRAIYKGMLQFLAAQHQSSYVVQPLPVEEMAIHPLQDNEMELTWKAVDDPLEPTATAEQYIVYTRIGNGAFDKGVLVKGNRFRTTLPTGVVCSFKVTAVNKGGESFPSEILSAGIAPNSLGTIMVVNGFDRISAPADFVAPASADTLLAGFLDKNDHGVPYLQDISYIGSMKEFRRSIPWMDDDAAGFGDSYGTHETQVIAGNSFDYPAIHGKAMLQAGYSFVSCSDEAVERGTVRLNNYPSVDLILGKECQTKMGRGGVKPLEFKTFTPELQKAIRSYCAQGGNLFASGAFIATDLWDNPLAPSLEEDRKFATDVLKYQWRVGQAALLGKVRTVASPLSAAGNELSYYNELNGASYVVEAPDAIVPACKEAYTVMRYAENNLSAAVAYQGDYKTYIMGFPFESIRSEKERNLLMKEILNFFRKD